MAIVRLGWYAMYDSSEASPSYKKFKEKPMKPSDARVADAPLCTIHKVAQMAELSRDYSR